MRRGHGLYTQPLTANATATTRIERVEGELQFPISVLLTRAGTGIPPFSPLSLFLYPFLIFTYSLFNAI